MPLRGRDVSQLWEEVKDDLGNGELSKSEVVFVEDGKDLKVEATNAAREAEECANKENKAGSEKNRGR